MQLDKFIFLNVTGGGSVYSVENEAESLNSGTPGTVEDGSEMPD